MSSRLKTLIAPALLAAMVAGCGGGGDGGGTTFGPGNGGSSTNGVVTISITDAPVDFASHVFIEFAGIELTPEIGNRLTLDINPDRPIDLLTLTDGATSALLQNQSVPAGRYTAIRFIINAQSASQSNSFVDLITGERFPIVVPTGSESGLTVTRDFTVSDTGGQLTLVADFDLRKSLVEPTGGSPSYSLKPSIRLVDSTQVGTISGTVGSNLVTGLCTPYVYVFSGANVVPDDIDLASDVDPIVSVPVKLNNSSGAYTYRASFLEAGNYTVSFVCLTGTQDDQPEVDDLLSFQRIQQATVTVNQTTTVDFTS
jgi:Domain of unknown function (DUF4382)